MSKITLVTCLFDIARRRTGASHRTVAELLGYSDPVLSLDQDLVIFCDPGMQRELAERRAAKGLTDRTKIVVMPLESLPRASEWLPQLQTALLPATRNLAKDTPHMLLMGWSKPRLMALVAEENPFGATHVGWIDLGIAHAGCFPISPNSRPFDDLPSKVRLHHLYPFDLETVSKPGFWDSTHCLIAAGWMLGDLEHVRQFAADFEREADTLLATGRASIDEDLLAVVVAKNPTAYESRRVRYPDLLNCSSRPLLALVMMVKNESMRIAETLRSVKPFIDTWSILDTGSTDGTQGIIRKELEGVPGFLDEEPIKTYEDTGFIDYAESRNRGLELAAQTHAIFYLLLNGDDFLREGPKLREHCERLRDVPQGGWWVRLRGETPGEYTSTRLTRADANWRYHCPTHEVLSGPDHVGGTLSGCYIYHLEDSWETRINRWHRDEKVLMRYWEKNHNDPRTAFYLAQTQECLGEDGSTVDRIKHLMSAVQWYQTRASLGGWIEEVYEARQRAAACSKKLQKPWAEVQQMYLEAHATMAHRMEPLWQIAQHYHEEDNHALCYLFALRGLNVPFPVNDALGVDREVYEWRLHDLVAIHAFYLGEHDIGRAAGQKAVSARPDDMRMRHNLAFYAKSSKDLFGSFESKELKLEDLGIYHVTNPSIIWDRKGRSGVIRSVNYRIIDGGYVWPEDDHTIRTRNWWVDFDQDWNITKQVEILDKTNLPRIDFPVRGYEDCRIFRWRDKTWLSAVACDLRYMAGQDGAREIVLLELDDDHHVVSVEPIRGSWSKGHQKNWMPMVEMGSLSWIYSTLPFQKVAYSRTEEPSFQEEGMLRGGSQVISAPGGGRLWLVHEVTVGGDYRGRIYLHRFVYSKTGSRVDGLSPPFYLLEKGIEFAAGLARDGDRFVVSFGVADKAAHLGFLDCKRVMASLTPYSETLKG